MAAKKKNFEIDRSPVFNTIETATAEPAEAEAPARKERKTYSTTEQQQFLDDMRTAGRKGVKLPRINLALAPDIYDYVRTMARARGTTITEFVNHILAQSLADNSEVYEKALEFRNSL